LTPTNLANLPPEAIKEAIAQLEAEGLVAASGTVIEPYKVKNYTYYRLCDSKGHFLIHLGNKESEWYSLFSEAVKRRKRITELKQLLKAQLDPLSYP
jgi:DNA-binding Lrp family transcriptional regulator